MEKTNWRAFAELIAVVSVVLSLIFVGSELRLSRAVAVSENFANVSDRALTFRQALVENADVWRKGCLGEEMTETERVQFFSLLEMFNFRLFASWQNATSGTSARDPDAFARSVARTMYWFPAFLIHESLNSSTEGVSGWTNAIDEQYSLLASMDFPRDVDVAHCGR